MANALAPTTFVAGAQDDLAAVDVYTRTDPGVINRTPDILRAPPMETIGTLRGGPSALALLPAFSEAPKPPFALPSSVSGLKSMLGKSLPGIPSIPGKNTFGALTRSTPTLNSVVSSASGIGSKALESLGGTLGTKAAAALRVLTPTLQFAVANKLNRAMPRMGGALASGNLGAVVAVSGIQSKIPGANILNVNSLLDAVGSTTGTPLTKVVDQGAVARMVGGLAGQGSANNVSGMVTQLWPVLTTEAQKTEAVAVALPDVISHSDLNTLKEFSSLTPSTLTKVNSGVLNEFATNYKPAAPSSNKDCVGLFSDIKTTFGAINPGWYSVGQGAGGFDVSVVASASPEFKRIVSVGALASENPDDKHLLVAEKIPVLSADDVMKNVYPLAAAQPESTSTQQLADLRRLTTIQ